jgi:hypothetical protein
MPPSSVYRLTSVAISASACANTRRPRLAARRGVTRVGSRVPVDSPSERVRTRGLADVFMLARRAGVTRAHLGHVARTNHAEKRRRSLRTRSIVRCSQHHERICISLPCPTTLPHLPVLRGRAPLLGAGMDSSERKPPVNTCTMHTPHALNRSSSVRSALGEHAKKAEES